MSEAAQDQIQVETGGDTIVALAVDSASGAAGSDVVTGDSGADAAVDHEVEQPDPEPAVVQGMKAAIVVGALDKLPLGYALVIVVEGRVYHRDEEGRITGSDTAPGPYPEGADLYLRLDPAAPMPTGALTMGREVAQNAMGGFTPREGLLNVGPAHPAFAGANLAYQRGARVIDIIGLDDGEKERLKPWIDELPTHASAPAQVAVSFL